jgi:predicted Zn-dependent peptidase
MVDTWAYPTAGMMLLIQFDTEDAKAPKLIELAIEGIENIATNGVNDEYVAKTKESMLKAFPEKHIKNSYWLDVMYENYSKNYDMDSEFEKCVNDVVNSKSIQKYAKEILKQGNRIKLVMNPEK